MNETLLVTFGRVKFLSLEQIEQHELSTVEQVEDLYESKMIKRKNIPTAKGTQVYYELTETGEKLLLKTVPSFGRIYRGFNDSISIELSKFYLSLTQDERNTWRTRDDLLESAKVSNPVDGAYVNREGKRAAVKFLTLDKTREDVDKIELFLAHTDIELMTYLFV